MSLIRPCVAFTREQSAGVAQVGAAVQELDRSTQQNAALVEETSAAAGALSEHAARLAREVSFFKLRLASRRQESAEPGDLIDCERGTPAPAGTGRQWRTRWAPTVVHPHGLKTCSALNLTRCRLPCSFSPARGRHGILRGGERQLSGNAVRNAGISSGLRLARHLSHLLAQRRRVWIVLQFRQFTGKAARTIPTPHLLLADSVTG